MREALGPYWTTLKSKPGSGFLLFGKWAVLRHDGAMPSPVSLRQIGVDGETPASNFPATATLLLGRAAAVARLRDLIATHRVVTVTGTGGIGKTSLALNVARRVLGDFPDGGWLVELAPLADPALVRSAVARALGLPGNGKQISAEKIARAVGNQRLLLLLDNCEHVVQAAAEMANTCVRLCPRIAILATSREALRIEGEVIYPLPPLEVPTIEQDQPDVIRDHSAVQLFVARTTASNSDFTPRAEELRVIAEICRHLDGIPLAIEFAAARTATLGVAYIANSLGDRFAVLTSGLRHPAPRHQDSAWRARLEL